MDIKEKLINYHADVQGIEDRFLEDYELYEECLKEFFNDPSFKDLEDARNEKNVEKAFDAAHTLKGVAGNLGLTPLYNVICKVVEPLRAGSLDQLDDGLVELNKEKAHLIELFG